MSKTELILNRVYPTPDYIIGTLAIDGEYFSDTLERPDLNNAPMISCIPKGTYVVKMLFSPHFQRLLPHIMDVPERENIMIHPMNTVLESEGCVGTGRNTIKGGLTQSRDASDRLNALLADCPDISITII